jgi:hypothetical protein
MNARKTQSMLAILNTYLAWTYRFVYAPLFKRKN